MIASTIGRTFLMAYNSDNNSDYSAKEFFGKYYFELFFNHPKYMQWVTNSPFVQMKSGQKAHLLTDKDRQDKLQLFFDKIEAGEADASIAIGFPASETKEFATTSGGVTDMDLGTDSEEVYLSWIGGGLGVGVAGGYSIFFNEPEILLDLFKGWKVYRELLNDPLLERMRGNQINTWNGQWLSYFSGKRFRKDFDFNRLDRMKFFSVSEKVIEINTIKWSELFFNISNKLSGRTITGYVYSLGQTNKTLGFYPFHFDKADILKSYYKKLFGENAALQDAKDYEALFGLHIKRACELGSIGLQALEPKNLRKYLGDSATIKLAKPNIKQKGTESDDDYSIRRAKLLQKDYENIITYRTYKIWLLAMITKNKEESLEYTKEVAKALLMYRLDDKKGSRKRVNLIDEELLSSKSKKYFIGALTELINDVKEENLLLFRELRDRVHLMSMEDFGYFVVLLRFDYTYEVREA